MNKYISIFKNWRNDVLLTIFALSLYLLIGETENLFLLISIKLLALLGFASFYTLLKVWNDRGLISDLTDLAKED